jgi:hypothetical protein
MDYERGDLRMLRKKEVRAGTQMISYASPSTWIHVLFLVILDWKNRAVTEEHHFT